MLSEGSLKSKAEDRRINVRPMHCEKDSAGCFWRRWKEPWTRTYACPPEGGKGQEADSPTGVLEDM